MQHLTVIAHNRPNGLLAISANGFDLGTKPGCFTWAVIGKGYPYAHDYFNYLYNQGWRLVSSNPLNFNESIYNFEGGYCYKITWDKKQKSWQGEAEDRPDYYDDYVDW